MTTNGAEIKLPRQQQVIVDLLMNSGDVSIKTVFDAIGGPRDYYTNRRRQQYLQTYIRAANRHLAERGLAIRPGEMKRTYRLYVV